PLVLERNRLFRRRESDLSTLGVELALGLAEHLDVAAERNRREAPACAVLVSPAEQLGTEADREGFDAHTGALRHVIVTHLVDEDQNRQDDEKWKYVVPERIQELHGINHQAFS